MTVQIYSPPHSMTQALSHAGQPATLKTWQRETLQLATPGTHWGFVFAGQAWLHRGEQPEPPFPLPAGMYFSLPEAGVLDGATSAGFVVTCPTYHGVFGLGGPIEHRGRLAYVNGGTNSVLIPPPLLGDPCLHAMYLPPQVEQTMHTHPSYRIGMLVNGKGQVETPNGVDAIAPGDIFLIPADQEHRFCTATQGLCAVVFHPDSEVGFSHRQNPMLQRTLVEEVSAAALPHLQTPILEK